MIVTNGVALTGTRDGKVIEFEEGETVWCPPDIDHWHGATPQAPMTHLVITGSRDAENVIWKKTVTDEEYYGNRQPKEKAAADIDALTAKQQALIPIAAYTANGDLESLKAAIQAGLNAGLSVNEIKKIQIHLYAYAAFPRALNGLATLMTVRDGRKAEGITDTLGEKASPLPANKSRLELGKKVQTELSGKPVSGPLFDFAPDINQLLQSHLFGDLFARDILDYQSREIATLSALASMDRVDAQLKAHIRIALGATADTDAGALRIYSVHLDNRINMSDRLRQLAPVLERGERDTDAVIIGGDLNTGPFCWLAHLLPVVCTGQAARLEAAVRQQGYATPAAGVGPTSKWLGMRLDALFTRGLTPVDAGVDSSLRMSDHLPLWLDVRPDNFVLP